MLLYLDPADSGYDATNSTSKKVMWYAGDTADWVNRGDPLTPGYPATGESMLYKAREEPRQRFSRNLSRIPFSAFKHFL